MTTPDTAEVRAWARSQGLTVADRGRLPAELRVAYLAAHEGRAPGQVATAPQQPAPQQPAPEQPAPEQPAPDGHVMRLVRLEEQVAALSARVAELERPQPATSPPHKPALFRRRRG